MCRNRYYWTFRSFSTIRLNVQHVLLEEYRDTQSDNPPPKKMFHVCWQACICCLLVSITCCSSNTHPKNHQQIRRQTATKKLQTMYKNLPEMSLELLQNVWKVVPNVFEYSSFCLEELWVRCVPMLRYMEKSSPQDQEAFLPSICTHHEIGEVSG